MIENVDCNYLTRRSVVSTCENSNELQAGSGVCLSYVMYVCVCVCIYVCVCMYVCMCVCVCMYECMYVRVYVCTCVCLYVCIYMCVCVYVRMGILYRCIVIGDRLWADSSGPRHGPGPAFI